jgi:hypothetical protein
LRLVDLGYWSLEAFAALEQRKVFWLSRLQMQTAVSEATGDRQELLELLETQATETVDRAVALGERQHLAARLLAVWVPQDVAELRRRRLRAAARDQGRQVSATHIERFNNTLRQRVSRLVRDALSFSKKLANPIGAITLHLSRQPDESGGIERALHGYHYPEKRYAAPPPDFPRDTM